MDTIVVAYMDRLVRSVAVQLELVERVERAGGAILTLDHGALTNGNATQRLSGTMLGAVNAYQRELVAERTHEAKERAVARRRAVPEHSLLASARRGATARARPGRRTDRRRGCPSAGRRRDREGSPRLLGGTRNPPELSRRPVLLDVAVAPLGELHFGKSSNLEAFPRLIDVETFNRVQRLRLPRGRRPKSERLLARLGVLRCATCGSRMVVGYRTTRDGKRYEHYRCPPVGDCPQRVTVAAEMVEQAVEQETRRRLSG